MKVRVVLVFLVCAGVVRAEETPAYKRLKGIAAEMAKFGMPVDVGRVRLTVKEPTSDRMRIESPIARVALTEADHLLDRGWGRKAGAGDVLAAGYYEASERRITLHLIGVTSWVDGDSLAAHELTHALQHQRDPMSLSKSWSSTERTMIQMCMIEGEAQVAALMVRLARRGGTLDEVDFSAADFALRAGVGGFGPGVPYTAGFRFMGEHAKRIGMSRLGEVTRKPPPSVEQILHPRKLGRDRPTPIRFPPLPEGSLMKADTLGELGLRYHLVSRLKLADAIRSSIGWDGDRLRVYETTDGKWFTLWVSVWDRAVDAMQAETAVRKAWHRGKTIRLGRTVSWVYAPNFRLRAKLVAALRQWDCSSELDEGAAASTAAVEKEAMDRCAQTHRIREGRWHLPEVGLSIPVPEKWILEVGAHGAVLRKTVAGRTLHMLVDSWPMAAYGDLEGLSDYVGRLPHPLHWTRVTQVARIERNGVVALRVRRRPMEGKQATEFEIVELYVPLGGVVVRYAAMLALEPGHAEERRAVLRAFADFRVERE